MSILSSTRAAARRLSARPVLVGLAALSLSGVGVAIAQPAGASLFGGIPGQVNTYQYPNFTCNGILPPQVIPAGNYTLLTINGLCQLGPGLTRVSNGINISPGAVLDAANFLPGTPSCSTHLDVLAGGINVSQGGVLFYGNGPGTGCPNSNDQVGGGIIANSPLAVVVHGASISGPFSVTGGGGGTSCYDMRVFKFPGFSGFDLGAPPFTDLEDSQVSGPVTMSGQATCWQGIIRNTIHASPFGGVNINNNLLGDPDAIEVGANTIFGNLSCSGNGPGLPNTTGGVPTNVEPGP
ncbi:MAG TPA: hypothetical protein VFH45_02320, partial [Acidimicrobiales bacterium]|nr:hypothetical protein [Acidimicrobiales bacterium]